MAYADAFDLVDRKSAQTIGDLVSDSGEAVDEGDLSSNARVTAALDSASGAIESALLAGGRYSTADLGSLSGNGLAYLKMITCDIAMTYLFARKPTTSVDEYKAAQDLADVHLERLRKGERIFNIAEVVTAGVPSYSGPTVPELRELNLIRDRTNNYFPARRLD